MPATSTRNISAQKPYKKKTLTKKKSPYKKDTSTSNYKKPTTDMALKKYHNVLQYPFGEKTQPSGVPDRYGGRTVTMKLIHNFSVTPDTDGQWAIQVFPSVNGFFRTYQNINNGAPDDFNATQAHPQWASFASSAAFIKPVCLAAKCSYTGRQELLSGLTSSMISNETTSASIPAIVDWGAEQGTHAVTIPNSNKALEAVSKLYDAPDFEDAAGHDSGTFLNKMSAILMGGSSWPSGVGAVVYIETVMYVEIIPKINSVLSFSEKPSPSSNNFHTNVDNHHRQSSTAISTYFGPANNKRRSG